MYFYYLPTELLLDVCVYVRMCVCARVYVSMCVCACTCVYEREKEGRRERVVVMGRSRVKKGDYYQKLAAATKKLFQ